MASVKYGAFITGMKGSIGGTVFQGGANGDVALEKAIASSAKLTKADAGRIINTLPIIGVVAGAWRNLTDAERLSWNTGAVNFPMTDRFGVSYTPTGYQVFMRLCFQYYQINTTILSTCPLPASIPAMVDFAIAQPDLTSLDLTWSVGLPSLYITRVEATQPMGKGRSPKNSFYKVIHEIPDSDTSPTDLFPFYAAVYGSFPANCMLYFRFTFVSGVTGEKGIPFIIALETT